MRILLTNATLGHRAGTELVVLDLARAYRARGHTPIAYSPNLGPVATELREAGVSVIDDLALLGEAPDVIHGHHQIEAMTAMLRFPTTPAIFVCHGYEPEEERPFRFPSIGRYVAVDEATRQRLSRECGLAEEAIEVILNFVDLDRFKPRAPLPLVPKRALVFSNRASEATFVPPIRRACEGLGLNLDVAGLDCGRVAERPEDLLPHYDLVFAKARCALEAMAVGCAVILCDEPGLGPLVQSESLDRLRAQNFGLRVLSRQVDEVAVAEEVRRYDASDAAKVAARVRQEAGLQRAADRYLELYGEVCSSARPCTQTAALAACGAASAFLAERGRAIYNAPYLWRLLEEERRTSGLVGALSKEQSARVEMEWMQQTAAWRLRGWLLGRPFWLACYRWLRGCDEADRVRRTDPEA